MTEVLRLLRNDLGEKDIRWTEEYWRWKHQDNPSGSSIARIAVADGIVIGIRVFMRCDLVAGEEGVACARPVDTVTHPEWRRRGVFGRLTRDILDTLEKEGVPLIFNTPNTQSLPANESLGWSRVGRIRYSVKLIRPLRIVQERLIGLGSAAGDHAVRRTRTWDWASHRNEPGLAPMRAFLMQPDTPSFIESCCKTATKHLTVPFTIDYLHWRYAAIPGVDYHACWNITDGRGAVVIFRITHSRNLTVLRLCDILVDQPRARESVSQRLIKKVIDVVEPDYAVSVPTGGTRGRRALRRLGFIPIPRSGRILVANQLRREPALRTDPLDIRSWELSLGSLEIF